MTEFGEIQKSTGKINYFTIARMTKNYKKPHYRKFIC